ncbi:MAG: HAD family hydrolase [Anaerovoracaceae bacterium]
MAIKLIALDLDGTTLKDNNEISEETIRAFKLAMEKGIHIVISTGRCFHSLPDGIKSVKGLEYAVTSNGAEIRVLDTQKCIYRNCIDSKAIEEIYKVLTKYNYMTEVFTDGRAYISEKEYNEVLEGKHPHRTIKYVTETRNKVPDSMEFMMNNKETIENINVFFENQEEKDKMYPILDSIKNVTLTSSLVSNYELGGETTSKASALKELASRIGVCYDEIMAVGDSPNDIEMLKLAKVSVAVANARQSVKDVAAYMTDSNNDDGVAKAILKYAINEN